MPLKKILTSRRSVEKSVLAACQAWASSRSKGPHTKVGAAVYEIATGAMHFGYNGFPQGVPDLREIWERREADAGEVCKYDVVVHAETNAVRKALRAGVDPAACILVCTHFPCAQCWKDAIAANGILNVCYRHGAPMLTAHDYNVSRFFVRTLGVNLRKI